MNANNNFKTVIKKSTTDKLNIMLDTYAKILNTTTETSIEVGKKYLQVNPVLRERYESLVSELYYAKSYVNYLNSVNPELVMLYNMGMCDDYYYGSKREVSEAESNVEEIQSKILAIETDSTNQLSKEIRSFVLKNKGQVLISLIKEELDIRKSASIQSFEQ